VALKQFPSLIQTSMATSELTMSNLINNRLLTLPKDTPPRAWKTFVSEKLYIPEHPVQVDSMGRVHVYDDLNTFHTDMYANSPRPYGSLITMKTAQDVVVDEIAKWADAQDFSGGGGDITGVDPDGVLREVRVDTEVRVDIRQQDVTTIQEKETITEITIERQPIDKIKSYYIYTPTPQIDTMYFHQPGFTPTDQNSSGSNQVNQVDSGNNKRAVVEVRFNAAMRNLLDVPDFNPDKYQVIASNASNRFDGSSDVEKKANVRVRNKTQNGFDLTSNTIDTIPAAEAVHPIDVMIVTKGFLAGHTTVYMNLQPGQGY
jgi:hypothetical protein